MAKEPANTNIWMVDVRWVIAVVVVILLPIFINAKLEHLQNDLAYLVVFSVDASFVMSIIFGGLWLIALYAILLTKDDVENKQKQLKAMRNLFLILMIAAIPGFLMGSIGRVFS